MNAGGDSIPNNMDIMIPLVNNGTSIQVINEHHGEVIYLKWNPLQKLLATGGHNDNIVDIWDF